MAKKKKVHHEEHADESWLLPYSDLLTLLLALFIVMFAMSKLDNEKFENVSKQFNIIFSGGNGLMKNDGGGLIPYQQPGALPSPGSSSDSASGTGSFSNSEGEEDAMIKVKEGIEKEIKNGNYSDKVNVVLNKEGLEISIQDVVLFNSGDAEILSGVSPLLMQISKILSGLDNNIKVVGHTDTVPINTVKFRSNWDLSAMRAINVMHFLVDKGGLNPEIFSVQGYGQYSPKFSNSTEEGRAKNRRVEIFITRKYPVDKNTADNKNSIQK